MAKPSEYVVEYDLRIAPHLLPVLWDRARRAEFLLDEEAATPLSRGRIVWPSLRHVLLPGDRGYEMSDEMAKDPAIQSGLARLRRMREDVAPILSRWPGECVLGDLLRFFEEQVAPISPDWWVTAFTCLAEERGWFSGQEPAEVDPAWTLLGYDVCDDTISGLTNCGYGPAEEKRPFAERFAGMLNEFHLFRDADAAQEFVAVSNKRVPEHSPFHAYGLYRV